MTEEQIQNVLQQIEAGKDNRRQTYHCCNEAFSTLYEFRRHLFQAHPWELEVYFASPLHKENPGLPTKEELHRKANKGRKVKERARTKVEMKKHRERNLNAYPDHAKGDHFHLIYTPMGNKK